jgi:hypothetical protein
MLFEQFFAELRQFFIPFALIDTGLCVNVSNGFGKFQRLRFGGKNQF